MRCCVMERILCLIYVQKQNNGKQDGKEEVLNQRPLTSFTAAIPRDQDKDLVIREHHM